MTPHPLKEVKERMKIFASGHRRAQLDAADLVDAICRSINLDDEHQKRVRNAFMGGPRERIKFSEARKMLGAVDTRTWNKRCATNPLFASIEIMWVTEKSAYCWEDEVCAVLAELNANHEAEPINQRSKA